MLRVLYVAIVFAALLNLAVLRSTQAQESFQQRAPEKISNVHGILERARQAAAAIHNNSEKVQALRDIAVIQAKAGDQAGARRTLQQALQTASAIKFGKDNANALIAVAQAEIGDVREALKIAGTIEENQYSPKAIILEAVAVAQAKRGDILGAVKTADIIKDISRRNFILVAIAVRLAEGGDTTRALQIAAAIQGDFGKSHVLSVIAVAQAKAGDRTATEATFQQALQAANAIQNPYSKPDAVGHIAIALAQAGEVPKALELASTLPKNDSRYVDVLGSIAVAQIKAGDVTGAFKIVAMLSGGASQQHDKAIRDVAVAQADAGDIPGAFKTADMIRVYTDEKTRALSGIALAQAKAGDYAGAITSFQTAKDSTRADLYHIQKDLTKAAAQAERGDMLGALEIAATIQDNLHKTLVLETVAVARAEAGEVQSALQTVAALRDNFRKSLAFSKIAVMQARAGDKASAEATFQQALQAANLIQKTQLKRYAMARIAVAQAEATNVPKAIELASTFPDNSWKAGALGEIAGTQARFRDVPGAFETVGMIAEDRWKQKALRHIAVAQAEDRDVKGALQTVALIRSNGYENTLALLGIAEAQAKAGDQAGAITALQQAIESAVTIRDNLQALALVHVAHVQRKIGEEDAARETLQKALKTSAIQDEVSRAALLKDIAVAQAMTQDIAQALKTAATIPEVAAVPAQPHFKLQALEAIAKVQVEVGDERGLSETVAMVQGESEKAFILRGIAKARAEVGDIGGALNTAQAIKTELRKANALAGIAIAQLKSGDLRGALLTSLTIREGGRDAFILRNVVKAHAKRGDMDDYTVWFIDQCPPALRLNALLGWAEGILAQSNGFLESRQILEAPFGWDPQQSQDRIDTLTSLQRTIQKESRKIKVPRGWQKLSDKQIARLLFPNDKLYFQPDFEGIPMEAGSIVDEKGDIVDDVKVVHNVKRVVANLDDDPKDEMAVLINFSTGLCTSCGGQIIFAILDQQKGKVRIRWSTKENEGYDRDGPTSISAVKLISKDKYFGLVLLFNTSPLGFNPDKTMRIIRWDGNKFAEIWAHTLQSYDSGNREGFPHDYLAKLDFVENTKEGAKRIKVTSIYESGAHAPEVKKYVLHEEFAWSEKDQRYLPVSQLKSSDFIDLFEQLKAPPNLIDDLKAALKDGSEEFLAY
jgi:tetratricopeptide (TPR) repeat protein